MRTAVLIDGDFFIRRFRHLCGAKPPGDTARELHRMCLQHLKQADGNRSLYRIFFYDCPPLSKKVHNPITKRAIDFSRSDVAIWRSSLHDELRRLRKVALRMGYLNEQGGNWIIRPSVTKLLLNGEVQASGLNEDDVYYDVKQKGVDMRIALDIASMTFKRQVDQIVLVSGDSDFVPAAKLARREGIDFVLDPLWASIRPDLHEHVDGVRTVLPRPTQRASEVDAANQETQ